MNNLWWPKCRSFVIIPATQSRHKRVSIYGCASEFCEGDSVGMLSLLSADAPAPPRVVGGRALRAAGLAPCAGAGGAASRGDRRRDGHGAWDVDLPRSSWVRPPPVPGLVLAILGALRPGCRPPGAASQRAPPHHRRDMRPGTGPPGPFQAPLPHQRMGALHTATADGRAAGMGPGRGQPGPPLRHIAPTLPHGGGGRASVALYGAARPTPLCQPLTRTRGGIAEVILRGMWRCRALSNFRTNGALSLWVHRVQPPRPRNDSLPSPSVVPLGVIAVAVKSDH
jgi:hypothetical protein